VATLKKREAPGSRASSFYLGLSTHLRHWAACYVFPLLQVLHPLRVSETAQCALPPPCIWSSSVFLSLPGMHTSLRHSPTTHPPARLQDSSKPRCRVLFIGWV
jgi:hypothetical protein